MQILSDFGMDTITMAGTLEAKLVAMREAGFSQVMLMARDLAGHPGGVQGAVQAVKDDDVPQRQRRRAVQQLGGLWHATLRDSTREAPSDRLPDA